MSNQNANPNASKKNAGYLIANDRSNDRQPHFRGKVTVEGKEYLLSAWKKDPRDGKEMMSVELTDPATLPPRAGGQAAAGQPGAAPAPRAPAPARADAAPSAPRQQAPAPPAAPPPPGEDKAFDDIFGGDGSQW